MSGAPRAGGGEGGEDRVVDEGGAQESDRLLVALREVVERKVARGEVEQRVAEPLEPLVVQPRVDAASDGAVPERHARRRVPAGAESGGDDGVVDGRVGEGLAEQPKVAKLDAARLLEGGHRRVLLRLRTPRRCEETPSAGGSAEQPRVIGATAAVVRGTQETGLLELRSVHVGARVHVSENAHASRLGSGMGSGLGSGGSSASGSRGAVSGGEYGRRAAASHARRSGKSRARGKTSRARSERQGPRPRSR